MVAAKLLASGRVKGLCKDESAVCIDVKLFVFPRINFVDFQADGNLAVGREFELLLHDVAVT